MDLPVESSPKDNQEVAGPARPSLFVQILLAILVLTGLWSWWSGGKDERRQPPATSGNGSSYERSEDGMTARKVPTTQFSPSQPLKTGSKKEVNDRVPDETGYSGPAAPILPDPAGTETAPVAKSVKKLIDDRVPPEP